MGNTGLLDGFLGERGRPDKVSSTSGCLGTSIPESRRPGAPLGGEGAGSPVGACTVGGGGTSGFTGSPASGDGVLPTGAAGGCVLSSGLTAATGSEGTCGADEGGSVGGC